MEIFYTNDRLPMLGERVLAWVEHEENVGYWCVLVFKNDFCWYDGPIKAWARLSEPPERGGIT